MSTHKTNSQLKIAQSIYKGFERCVRYVILSKIWSKRNKIISFRSKPMNIWKKNSLNITYSLNRIYLKNIKLLEKLKAFPNLPRPLTTINKFLFLKTSIPYTSKKKKKWYNVQCLLQSLPNLSNILYLKLNKLKTDSREVRYSHSIIEEQHQMEQWNGWWKEAYTYQQKLNWCVEMAVALI